LKNLSRDGKPWKGEGNFNVPFSSEARLKAPAGFCPTRWTPPKKQVEPIDNGSNAKRDAAARFYPGSQTLLGNPPQVKLCFTGKGCPFWNLTMTNTLKNQYLVTNYFY